MSFHFLARSEITNDGQGDAIEIAWLRLAVEESLVDLVGIVRCVLFLFHSDPFKTFRFVGQYFQIVTFANPVRLIATSPAAAFVEGSRHWFGRPLHVTKADVEWNGGLFVRLLLLVGLVRLFFCLIHSRVGRAWVLYHDRRRLDTGQ